MTDQDTMQKAMAQIREICLARIASNQPARRETLEIILALACTGHEPALKPLRADLAAVAKKGAH